jgi:hypothetical protein
VRTFIAIAVAAAITLASTSALAEPPPPIHLTVPTTVADGEGHTLALPPGFFLFEETWQALDLEVKRLQDQETRLTAENQVLRESSDPPGWWWVVGGLAAGIGAGFAIGRL